MTQHRLYRTPKDLDECLLFGKLLSDWGVALHVAGMMLEKVIDKFEQHLTDIVVRYIMDHSSDRIMYNEYLTEDGIIRYTREQIDSRMKSILTPKMIVEQLHQPWKYVVNDFVGQGTIVIDKVPVFAMIGAKKLEEVVKSADDFTAELSIESTVHNMIKSVVRSQLIPSVCDEIDKGIMCACLRSGSNAECILKQLLKRATQLIKLDEWLNDMDFWGMYSQSNNELQ